MTFINRNGILYVSINGTRKTTKLKYSKQNIKKFHSYYQDEEFFNNFNINKKAPLVLELVEEILNEKEKEVKRNTFRSYLALYDSRIKPYFKKIYVSDFKPIDVHTWYKTFKDKSTLNTCDSLLKASFEKAILKNEDDRKNVIKKLKRFGYKEELMEILFRKLNFIEINEDDLYQNIKESFQNNPIVLLDLDIAFDLLMFWIYKLSEGKGFVNREILFEKLNKIGTFLVERKDFHSEYGNSKFVRLIYCNMGLVN